MAVLEILCGIVLVAVILYYYLIANYDFWEKKGIPGPKPVPLFGTFAPVFLGKMSMGDYMANIYNKYKREPVIGLYIRKQLVLAVHDPDLIKTILIKDFSAFSNRGIAINNVAEPLSQHLFSLESKRWRPLRTRLSPVFTSGKLKEMFSLISDCSNTLEEYLDSLVAKGEPVDFRELAAGYTIDVIGNCVFGINMDAISGMDCTFRKLGKEFFENTYANKLKISVRETMPHLYTLYGYLAPQDEMTKFFMKAVLDMIEYRKKNNIVRQDFINVIMDLEAHPEKLGNIKLTKSLLSAQAFVFFAAGFETSSTTISNALYELAQNQDVQDKLREEIKEHHAMNSGKWLYENIKNMRCLDAVFKETLRKYPPITVLMRKSMEDYTFEDIKVSIPKNTRIFIPMYGIHHDPEIYPNPEIFDIDRFKDDVVATRHPMHYLPFGDGPRNCIGARFAIFQSKMGLIKILRNYKLDVCEQTQIPYINNPNAFLLAPKHGIMLKVTKIES